MDENKCGDWSNSQLYGLVDAEEDAEAVGELGARVDGALRLRMTSAER